MNADVRIYARNLEIRALEQVKTLANTPAFKGAKIRIMPDAHAGAGCVIGFTANLGEKVVPNLVGVDIGCGMHACRLTQAIEDLASFDEQVKRVIPLGFRVNDKITCDTRSLGLLCQDQLAHFERLDRSLCSLGGGNHFIEMAADGRGDSWLIVHCGSRNLGMQVANIYQQRAVKECRADVAPGLEYLEGEGAQAYLHDMRICQDWARRNREAIVARITEATGIQVAESFHTAHNYIGDDGIIRKGAISAREGERVLIPLNMRDGSVIARGRGNEDWNWSAPHGAGRLMSRADARRKLDVEEFRSQMSGAGVYSSTVGRDTIDEAPGAYKNAEEILGLIAPTVTFDPELDRLKPIYNLKAADKG